MAETFILTPDARGEYVRHTALKAFFSDETYEVPRYTAPFESSVSSFRGLAVSMAELVTYNLQGIGRMSDQRWMRLSRAQFAIMDQDLVDNAGQVDNFVAAFTAGDYPLAAKIICPYLEGWGICISRGNTGGALAGQDLPVGGPHIPVYPGEPA